MKFRALTACLTALVILQTRHGYTQAAHSDQVYRPLIHFAPTRNWMNDPNGMVYYKGTYHLFFQHYPDTPVWGPMHWGHATSNDLVHWAEQAIALYPDSLGYIFSGSAVVDSNNTSGFGRNGKVPLVAIFTHHNPKAGIAPAEVQSQSLAYSLDDGKTWTKYARNPVLKSPGVADFRDPKVIWYEAGKKWIMALAVQDRISFYSSKDLKSWSKESEFGATAGAHGGVWECPDLFPLDDQGKQLWVLIVNLNPGGPNKGSATQYFVGRFNGKTFTPFDTLTRWLDYGPDEYAGVTWSNTGNRRLFIGWMSNWLYGTVVPTETWRSAMTVPRELKLKRVNDQPYVASEPVKELMARQPKPVDSNGEKTNLAAFNGSTELPYSLNLTLGKAKDFSITIANDTGEAVIVGFNKEKNQFYIDRTKSGKSAFHNEFAAVHTAPRLSRDSTMNILLIVDVASVELFADEGLTVMTEIFFPNKPYNTLAIKSTEPAAVKKFSYAKFVY